MTILPSDLAYPDDRVGSSVRMAVRARLRADILLGAYPGGTRLHQLELAKRYGVSVTPVREALGDLASEGLVDIGTFSGATVHAPSIRELEHIYEIRARLLPLAMSSAVANISPEALTRAHEFVEQMGDPEVSGDSWVIRNRELHRLLEGATENTHLASTLHKLADISALYVYMSDRDVGRRPQAQEEHLALLEAFVSRNEREVTRIVLRHIEHTLEHARAVLGDAVDTAKDPPSKPDRMHG